MSDLLAERSGETEPVEDNQADGPVDDAAASPTASQEPENNADLPNEATEGQVQLSAKYRKRFGPNEDYLLAAQVNKDMSFTAKHGGIRKAWQTLEDKLNTSPNFRMDLIKGTTAQARFEALMTKHRSFEARSVRNSGTDERETRPIQVLTNLAAKIYSHNAAKAKAAAEAAGAEQDKPSQEKLFDLPQFRACNWENVAPSKMVQLSVMMQRRLAVKRNPH
ncbi:unnamed protein product [Phytophthora fragariaefolia]|uniref:Unnamed protein product n=1 Tax=Phytophthora fragariaefolia TaxID=1490495 RepID=A0A9W6UEY9_9STRA|nr:unnamed protein product [Phytophthora fragariaefolia]